MNYEDSHTMTDAQSENVSSREGRLVVSSLCSRTFNSTPLPFIQQFFSVRDDAKLWERHKGGKKQINKTMPNSSKLTASGVCHQKENRANMRRSGTLGV